MPRGPRGEKRPADVIGTAIMVARIATEEIADSVRSKNPQAVALGKLGGAKGGKSRAQNMTPEQRSTAAKQAAKARWSQTHKPLRKINKKPSK